MQADNGQNVEPGKVPGGTHAHHQGAEEICVKSKLIVGLLITGLLVISAGAQAVMVTLPSQQSGNTVMAPAQLQAFSGARKAKSPPQQMEAVLQALSEDLGQIALAVRDGKITPEQAEYLSTERYYVGLMRFQLLRALHQNTEEENQRYSYSQPNTASAPSSDIAITIPAPTFSPDVPPQIASYLELNPAQLAAIQAQVIDDRKQVQPLLKQLENSRRKLLSNSLNGNCDVNKVRALAAEQSRILKQLIVANALLEAKVYKMLTSGQQHKLDELRRQTPSMRVSFPSW